MQVHVHEKQTFFVDFWLIVDIHVHVYNYIYIYIIIYTMKLGLKRIVVFGIRNICLV